jgi:hypothetical protein
MNERRRVEGVKSYFQGNDYNEGLHNLNWVKGEVMNMDMEKVLWSMDFVFCGEE